jgi:hypothetical protein
MDVAINSQLLAHLNSLGEQAAACGQAVVTGQGRRWMTGAAVGELMSADEVAAQFPFKDIDAVTEEILSDRTKGTVGTYGSSVVQKATMISLRRAMQLRHASPVRLRYHRAAEHLGYSSSTQTAVTSYIQDLNRGGQGKA